LKNLKKNLPTLLQQTPNNKVLFLDESRFGTHSKLGHGWFKRGTRTQVQVKLGFQSFYLYSAVSPLTGEAFSYIIPRCNTLCMNFFLAALSEEFNHEKLTIIMDGAGWHKSNSLIVPKNITIIHLPPYSPELNPVERLWQHIKKAILKNKIYESLDDLEDRVSEFLNSITADTFRRICSANYLFS
jgi:transposase